MKQQGFSLIEVLLSLMLVSSIILALIQQQQQSKQLLNQFIARALDSVIMDKLGEKKILQVDKLPTIAYRFKLSSAMQ